MSTDVPLTTAIDHYINYAFSIAENHINGAITHQPGGYCLFMTEKHEELKETEPDMSKRSSIIASLWKDTEIKKEYNKKAKNYVAPVVKNKSLGKLNSFQFYCKMKKVRCIKKNRDVPNITEMSKSWTNMSDEKKELYKQKTNLYNKNKNKN